MSEDLAKIREEYEDLENKLAAAWLESNKLKDRMSELREKLNELDEYKKQYIVRVYQEVYFDFEVDAFDEDDAVKVATESAPYEDMEICSYFASTPPRLKVVCLKADYKEEMEKNDG